MLPRASLWLSVVVLCLLCGCRAGDSASTPQLKVALVADQESISPGSNFTLGLRFSLEPGWHIYWKNPGDSGLAPRFSWSSSEQISVSSPMWPYPTKIAVGPLTNYGYGDVLIPFQASISQAAPLGSAAVTASVEWLVCKDECLPGEATLTLTLPIQRETALPSPHRDAFEAAFKNIPTQLEQVSIAIEEQADKIVLALIPLSDRFLPSSATFFPEERRVIANSATQTISRDGEVLRITLERDPSHRQPLNRLKGILWSAEGWSHTGEPHAVTIDTNPEAPPQGTPSYDTTQQVVASGGTLPSISFLTALLSALVGGLLLNIMPCVFPVLSIKILSFVEHSGDSPQATRNHGIAFAGGVIVSFWIVAASLFSLRAAGEQLGWGFQLQSPIFVVSMMITFLVIALLFLSDTGFGQQIQNVLARTRIPTSLIGSLLNGALATLVATPCTAPYMGTALAATLALPHYLTFLIFTALGLGMSAPYVLLASKPSLLRYLPRPGEWMITFKQLMAFPLLASVVWLMRVFTRQMGLLDPSLSIVSNALWGLLGVAFAFWVFGRTSNARTSTARLQGVLVALVVGVASCMLALPSQQQIEESRASSPSLGRTITPFTDRYGLLWEPFSEDRVSNVLAQGRPVLIDFTAEWCITCQVNERVVFSSQAVRDLLLAKNITLFRADWTAKDPAITLALRRYGRTGVPLNVIITPWSSEPVLLPNILTPGIVQEALEKI
jgi:thiol:disulfide interchange protein